MIACNTASALALDALEKEIDIPIIGVVKPGAKVAARETTKKRVGVIATEATINSHLYKELIQQIDPEITVIGKAMSAVRATGGRRMAKRSRHRDRGSQISERDAG